MPGKTKKAAFVTGGAKRIGRATAIALAKAGYDIALHYNKSKADAEIVAREISNMGRTCKLFSSNFNDFSKISDLVSDIFNAFPNCNVLVNSVSIFIPARFPDTTPELFDQTINVNFKVPFFLSREFALRCEKGNIINLLDTRISKITLDYFIYSQSKKALFDFTRMAAMELAPQIRVNGVCPGLVLPPPGKDRSYLEEKAQSIPLKKVGTVNDVISAIVFLLQNEFITGQCIFADGGEHLM